VWWVVVGCGGLWWVVVGWRAWQLWGTRAAKANGAEPVCFQLPTPTILLRRRRDPETRRPDTLDTAQWKEAALVTADR